MLIGIVGKSYRKGVRFHIHNLEKRGLIVKKGIVSKRNVVYGVGGGERC